MSNPTPSACPCALVKPRIRRRVVDSRTHGIEWDYAEFDAGQTISAATVVADPTDLTVGTVSTSGNEVQVELSGGRAGVTYELAVTVTTSGGAVLGRHVLVEVCG